MHCWNTSSNVSFCRISFNYNLEGTPSRIAKMSPKKRKAIEWHLAGPDMLRKHEERKRLSGLGWTIEYRDDQHGSTKFRRFRYSLPGLSKTYYYSLQSIQSTWASVESKSEEHSMQYLRDLPMGPLDSIPQDLQRRVDAAPSINLLSSPPQIQLHEDLRELPMGPLDSIPQDLQRRVDAAPCNLLSSPLQIWLDEDLRELPMGPLDSIPQDLQGRVDAAPCNLLSSPPQIRLQEDLRELPMGALDSIPQDLQRRVDDAPCNLLSSLSQIRLHEDLRELPMGPLDWILQDLQRRVDAAPCNLLSSPLQMRVHEDLRESLMKILSPISPIPQDGQKCLAIVPSSPLIEEKSTKPSPNLDYIEPEYYPQAIVEYVNLGSTQARDQKNDHKLLKAKVKKHLLSVGWEIFYMEKAPGREELRYQSPSGRRYISLITACKGYLNEQQKSDQTANASNMSEEAEGPTKHYLALTRSTDDFDSDFSNRVSKRARQVAAPSFRQNPRNILARLIDNNKVSAGAEVHYRGRDGRPMAEGHVTRDGIKCHCCQEVFNLSNFEAHAGSTNHRPAANIFLKDGRSLQDCQLPLKRGTYNNKPRKVMRNRKYGLNGYICSVCHNDGALVLCYQCPSSFHTRCLGLEAVPNGDWFCQQCEDQPTNEAEYCPQAIVDYFLGGNILTLADDSNKKLRVLRLKAKKHLFSVGWSFIYTSEGTKRELQYKSPSGRVYVSLIEACEGCIYEDGSQIEQLTTLSD